MVDLAGSERVQTAGWQAAEAAQRLAEAQFINKSLAALGDCIHALAHERHVPYRNSRLTHLLQVLSCTSRLWSASSP